MKRLFLVSVLLLAASGATAQNTFHMARTGVYEKDGELVVENPVTTLEVDLKVVKEEILTGPYARYAQKFLGVRAPLTDKTTYTLEGAYMMQGNDAKEYMPVLAAVKPETNILSHSHSEREFARLLPDKMDMTTPTLEDAAREAANTIFSLRKHRMELITGEAGENVFGAGLKAALDEIDRQEQSYLELFFGKHITTTSVMRKLVTPAENSRQMILCRFSPEQGVVPEDDLSGEIVLLQLNPLGAHSNPYEIPRKVSGSVTYRIASPTECTILYGNRVLSRNILSIFQFGRTANIAPIKK